ncbi:hypothetical protein C5167_035082 [Papaver somniferum]|uniref:Uncharacterized protein n=1 Tax=Papaver somniferum TaxID=3469 RepID=A0A4Y7KHU6_PAPSO|nr:hypothetical protein C5167_035082 [Papaver somniferum]
MTMVTLSRIASFPSSMDEIEVSSYMGNKNLKMIQGFLLQAVCAERVIFNSLLGCKTSRKSCLMGHRRSTFSNDGEKTLEECKLRDVYNTPTGHGNTDEESVSSRSLINLKGWTSAL